MFQKEDTEKSRSTRFLAIAYAGVGSSNEKVPTPFGAIYTLKSHFIGYMLTRCGRGRFLSFKAAPCVFCRLAREAGKYRKHNHERGYAHARQSAPHNAYTC